MGGVFPFKLVINIHETNVSVLFLGFVSTPYKASVF